MKVKVGAAVVATACAVLAAAGPAAAQPKAKTTVVKVSAFEMGFKVSSRSVPRGTVVLQVTNTGKLPHDLSFGNRGGKTAMLNPGAKATLKVKFAKAGKYTYLCTVPGHLEAGMTGALTVK